MLHSKLLAFLSGDVSRTSDKGMYFKFGVTVYIANFSPKKTSPEASEESTQITRRGFTKAELVARRLKRKQDRRVLKLMKEGVWWITGSLLH